MKLGEHPLAQEIVAKHYTRAFRYGWEKPHFRFKDGHWQVCYHGNIQVLSRYWMPDYGWPL